MASSIGEATGLVGSLNAESLRSTKILKTAGASRPNGGGRGERPINGDVAAAAEGPAVDRKSESRTAEGLLSSGSAALAPASLCRYRHGRLDRGIDGA